jgi:hypothetical protein
MPPSFVFPDSRVDVWIPAPLSRATADNAYRFGAVARMRDDATIEGVRAEITQLTAGLEGAYPNNGYKALVSTATTLIEATVGDISRTLWVLLASVGLVLLVACANVTNLFLRSRCAARSARARGRSPATS